MLVVERFEQVQQQAVALWMNEFSSGVLPQEIREGLEQWQEVSDRLRGEVVDVLAPFALVLGLLTLDCARWCGRVLGRCWGYWMASARERALAEAVSTGRVSARWATRLIAIAIKRVVVTMRKLPAWVVRAIEFGLCVG